MRSRRKERVRHVQWRQMAPATMPLFFLTLVLFVWAGCIPLPPADDLKIEISSYAPSQAYNGYTFFQSHVFYPGYYQIDMNGNVLWNRPQDLVVQGAGVGLDLTDDGNVITALEEHPTVINPVTDETLYTDPLHTSHHAVEDTPWGTILFLDAYFVPYDYPEWGNCKVMGDSIVEIDPSLPPNEFVVWEWKIGDHIRPEEHHWDGLCKYGGIGDWTHNNSVKLVENYYYNGRRYDHVLITLSRNLDTFFVIEYPSGNLLWSCGQHGQFGRREPPLEPFFNTAHEIEFVGSFGNYDRFLMYDNGEGRADQQTRVLELQVYPEARIVSEYWSWTDPDNDMFMPWGGDADRLPNGNTLVSNPSAAAITEVKPTGEKVWEMKIYQPTLPTARITSVFFAKRVPYTWPGQ